MIGRWTTSILDDVRTHAVRGDVALLAPGRPPATYAQLLAAIDRTRSSLDGVGLHRKSRVAVAVAEGADLAGALLAVMAHATCLPLNPALTEKEARVELERARIDALLVTEGSTGAARLAALSLGIQLIEVRRDASHPAGSLEVLASSASHAEGARDLPHADDVALLLYTSGTTARAKLVPLTHGMLAASAHNIARHLALASADRCLNAMPLFHSHGIVGGLLATIAAGGSVVCVPRFTPEAFIEALAGFSPTWYTAAPTIHQSFLAAAAEYRSKAPEHRFRFIRSASSSLSPATLQGLREMTGAPIVESYGMTESATQMASNPLPPGTAKVGSVGPSAGAELAVVDARGDVLQTGVEGEIVARGPGLFRGYENDDEANRASFFGDWFRTGDVGRFDEDGYLYIVGRLKEIINRGGEKIAPAEIEHVLLLHEGVREAAVFPAPHPTLGEDVHAVVVPALGWSITEAALRAFLVGRVADFKIPARIFVVARIPRTNTGKVQRYALAKRLSELSPITYEAPRPGYETVVAESFANVLGRQRFGRNDHFLESGGDSLSAFRAILLINKRVGLDLPSSMILRHPTVCDLASAAEAAHAAAGVDYGRIEAEVGALSDASVVRLLAVEDGPGSAKR